MTDLRKAAEALLAAYDKAIRDGETQLFLTGEMLIAQHALRAALAAPVAGVTVEEVVRVVCCPHGCEKGSYSGPCATLPGESRRVEIATALMPLFARAEAAGRAAGLEEAAKKVEENAGYWADAAAASDDFTPSERRIARGAALAYDALAISIRALAQKDTPDAQ